MNQPAIVVPRRIPLDPRVADRMIPLRKNPRQVYQDELERLRFDMIGDKQNEVRRRLRRLASMEQGISLWDNTMAILGEISVAFSRLGLVLRSSPYELSAVISDPEIVEMLRMAPKECPPAQDNADIDWCHDVTQYYLAKIWDAIIAEGYSVSRSVVEGDPNTEEVIFLSSKGEGWSFVQLIGGDFVFDAYRISSDGAKVRLPIFVQVKDREGYEDQGVPPSLYEKDEVALTMNEAQTYLLNWVTALDLVTRSIPRKEEYEAKVTTSSVLNHVLRQTSNELASGADDADPIKVIQSQLEAVGISSPEFFSYVKKIIPEARLQGMLKHYSLPMNLLG